MKYLKFVFVLLTVAVGVNAQTSPIDGVDARSDPAEFAKQLNSPDALVRQRSAEALARLAATDQRKLVEGYRLQEKNKDVRLALDWALYRMGRTEALYRIVDELDDRRRQLVTCRSWKVLMCFILFSNARTTLRVSMQVS